MSIDKQKEQEEKEKAREAKKKRLGITKTTEAIGGALSEAERKAKSKDIKFDGTEEEREIAQSLLEQLQKATGKSYYISEDKDPIMREAFTQNITRNLQLLVKIDYLTQSEEQVLFRIQNYLEFGTNVIVTPEEKNKTKKQKEAEAMGIEVLRKAATVTDIAKMIGRGRQNTSEILNSLKAKEILANPEGVGFTTENGRTVTTRTWVVNPHVILCGPRKKIDGLTKHLFRYSLKNLKDQKGKKVELPFRFFI